MCDVCESDVFVCTTCVCACSRSEHYVQNHLKGKAINIRKAEATLKEIIKWIAKKYGVQLDHDPKVTRWAAQLDEHNNPSIAQELFDLLRRDTPMEMAVEEETIQDYLDDNFEVCKSLVSKM